MIYPNKLESFFKFFSILFLVKWFKDSIELNQSSKLNIISEPEKEYYSLVIKNAESSDNGQYHAIATNANGEVLAAFSLIVN